jgi:hypothetical protein
MVRQNIMEAGICGRGYSPHGGQKAENDRQEDVRDKIPSSTCPLVIYFPPPKLPRTSQNSTTSWRLSVQQNLWETFHVQTITKRGRLHIMVNE